MQPDLQDPYIAEVERLAYVFRVGGDGDRASVVDVLMKDGPRAALVCQRLSCGGQEYAERFARAMMDAS